MATDFSGLVLAPNMDIFARDLIVTPFASQPGSPAYPARGIFSSKPVIIETATHYHSTTQPTLGIKLDEFPVTPLQQDQIEDVETGITYTIADITPDGQGGASIVLKDNFGTL